MPDPAILAKLIREWFSNANGIDVQYQRDRDGGHGPHPEYKTEAAAGADLCAWDSCIAYSGQVTSVCTEVRLAIPPGHFGFIKERSSIAAKGLWCVGGIIDEDYRGEIKVMLYNSNMSDYNIQAGDRIANIIFIPCSRAKFIPTSYLPPSNRGSGGFGSTGR